MKLSLVTVLCGLMAPLALAKQMPMKDVVVSYPQDTPSSVLDQAKEAIIEAVSLRAVRF